MLTQLVSFSPPAAAAPPGHTRVLLLVRTSSTPTDGTETSDNSSYEGVCLYLRMYYTERNATAILRPQLSFVFRLG